MFLLFLLQDILYLTSFLLIVCLISTYLWIFQFYCCINFFNHLFILFVLGLYYYMWAFSSCSKRGLLFDAIHRLFTVVTSLVHRTQALGAWASKVSACGLSMCSLRALELMGSNRFNYWGPWWAQWLWLVGSRSWAQQLWYRGVSCSEACRIILNQGSNLCPLH